MQIEITSGMIGGAMKVVVYGPEGIGKSSLAAQFPDPLFIDTEGSTRFMNVRRLPVPASWAMLTGLVCHVRDTPGLCSTLVLDTADWAEQLCITEICAKSRVSGIEEFGYGKGYVYLMEEFGRLLNLLNDVVDRGINVVLTAHAKMRKFEQPDEMGAYDRWEMKLQQKTAPLVKEWADLVLFANYKTMAVATDDKGKKFKAQGGRRVMYTTHHPCWDAKNRFGLPDEIPLDFAPLAHLFQSAAPVQQPVAPSSPVTPAPATTAAEAAPVEEPVQTDLLAETASTSVTADLPIIPQSDNYEELRALWQLMKKDVITIQEIQHAVAAKGYFPEDTPIDNLPADFIRGVLIGAWPQVSGWIKENRNVPF